MSSLMSQPFPSLFPPPFASLPRFDQLFNSSQLNPPLLHAAYPATHASPLPPPLVPNQPLLRPVIHKRAARRAMPPLSSAQAQLLPAYRRRQRRKRDWITMALEQVTPEQIMMPPPTAQFRQLPPQFEPPSSSAADNYNSVFIVRALSDVLQRTCDRNATCTLQPNPHIDARSTNMFYSCAVAPFSLSCYVYQLVTRLRLSRSVYIVALVFLDRVRLVDQRLCLIHLNVHRVLAAALCLADKFLEDECHRNSSFCAIAGIPSLCELNLMEQEFLRRLQWNCWVSIDTFEEYDTAVFSGNADANLVDAQAAVALESAAVTAAHTLSRMTSPAETTSHV